MKRTLSFIVLIIICGLSHAQVKVGAKNFPESHILAEIISQAIESETELEVERRFGLGGTLICFEALRTGEIDLYPEYTGTISQAILKSKDQNPGIPALSKALGDYDLKIGPKLGFNNTYVIAVRPELNLDRISDLAVHPELKLGFSNEYIKRQDGYSQLAEHYKFRFDEPKGLEHGLAYQALESGEIDVTDAYSTDGKLAGSNFQLLEDDLDFFPEYEAVPFYRNDLIHNHSKVKAVLEKLEETFSEEIMRGLNYRYEVEGTEPAVIAHEFLLGIGFSTHLDSQAKVHPILRQTGEHLQLTLLATLMAILVSVPLGLWMNFKPKMAGAVMAIVSTIQTIPSLALLGFMIPLFGIGFWPALIALFLYGLLPIVRNTYTGLNETDPILVEAATAMGMSRAQILSQLRLPLAYPHIISGIRTSLTINIGTATLAAFIGAGGLGESIITGITLNNHEMILQGAIPAALLAIFADLGIRLIERKLRPKTA